MKLKILEKYSKLERLIQKKLFLFQKFILQYRLS